MIDTNWWTKAVIYELYVDKFAGNFKNLTAKLDYFTYLGVNTLWILPHYPSPQVDGGYDISDYRDVRPDLGTLADFEEFVTRAHQEGLKVIIDMVLNHTSIEHPWFKQARSSKDNPKRDWYLWSDNQDKFPLAYVHFSHIKGTKNWVANPATGDYYYATFYKEQPDLNWDNPAVVLEMQDVIDFWLKKGVDGLRLDAISRLIKREDTNCFGLPETHHVIKTIRSRIDANFPGVVLLAEAGGWPDEARQFFGSGDECHLVLHFPLSVRMLNAINGRNLQSVADIWTWSGTIPPGCSWAAFLTSHDTVDVFFLGSDEEKRQFISRVDPDDRFSQTGDLDSIGARLAEVCRGRPEDIVWATKLLLDQPAIPVIYYGNEIGLRNLNLTPKPLDIREYVRGPFDWSEVDRQKNDPDSVLNSVRQLLNNRRNS